MEADGNFLAFEDLKSEDFLENGIAFKSKTAIKFAVLAAVLEEEEKKVVFQKKRFNLESLSDVKCKFFFRFTKYEILTLIRLFGLPNSIVTDDKSRFTCVEAMCITLRRMVYPNRLGDLQKMFDRSKSQLSRIFNWTLNFILIRFEHLLNSMDLFWLAPNYLHHFARKIKDKGAPLSKCVGFIDGTIRPLCRPGFDQKDYYNGHKRVHSVKFQSLVMPNGIISNLYGPVPGRRHDAYMLAVSNLMPKLEEKFGDYFYVYGDPAYPIRGQLIAPFRKSKLSPNEEQFNKSMSKVREAVEWEFGRVASLFAFVDFKKNLKLHLQPVAKYYKFAVLLANCHSCLNGTNTSTYFGVNPPTLEEYLKNEAS